MSDTEGELREQLIRQPVSLLFALLSLHFLTPYKGGDFWMLFGIHTALVTALSMAIVHLLTRRLFIFGDEMIGRAIMFAFFYWVLTLGSVGQSVMTPLRPALAIIDPSVMALQNRITGTEATLADNGDGALGFANWLKDLGRRWDYAFTDDGGWDSKPMAERTALSFVETRGLTLRQKDGKVYAVLMVHNGADGSFQIRIDEDDCTIRGRYTYEGADVIRGTSSDGGSSFKMVRRRDGSVTVVDFNQDALILQTSAKRR